MRLHELARQVYREEYKDVTFSPNINKESKWLVENYEPLYKRFEKEIEGREKKINKARAEKFDKEEEQYQKMIDRQKKIEAKCLKHNDWSDSPNKKNRSFYAEYMTKEKILQNNALSKFILI